jgi:hypothetical protein
VNKTGSDRIVKSILEDRTGLDRRKRQILKREKTAAAEERHGKKEREKAL